MLSPSSPVAASYERVSTRKQGQRGFSLGAQHQSLDDFARSNGWPLPEHLRFRDGEEQDASGKDWDLPGLTAMMEAARRREFSVLIVPDFDRFARSLVKGLVLEEQLKKYGVRVVYQRVTTEDTPEGQLLKHQLLSFAEYERSKIVLRTTTGRRHKAMTGRVVGGGPPPYGYRFTYEALTNGQMRAYGLDPDPLTAPIARRLILDLRWRSIPDVAAALNAEGIPGPNGGRWTAGSVHRIGTASTYAGTWHYGKNGRGRRADGTVAVAVPALVERSEWEQTQRALAHRRVARRGRLPVELDPFILRGMLTCGHCRGMLQTNRNSGYRYYRCAAHEPYSAAVAGKPLCCLHDVNSPGVEGELWRLLTETLLDEDTLAAGLAAARGTHDAAHQVRRDRLATVDEEVAKRRKRLDTLAARMADASDGEIFDALMRQAREQEDAIRRLDGERAELAAVRGEGLSESEADAIAQLAEKWRLGLTNATEADRRRLYEAIQVRGTIYLDPNGVRIGRRHRYRIDWQAAIPLSGSISGFLNSAER